MCVSVSVSVSVSYFSVSVFACAAHSSPDFLDGERVVVAEQARDVLAGGHVCIVERREPLLMVLGHVWRRATVKQQLKQQTADSIRQRNNDAA